MLSQLITRSKQYQNDLKLKPNKRSQIIQEIIESPLYESWMVLDDLIRTLIEQQQDSTLKRVIQQCIQFNYRNVKTFAMIMYLYTLQTQSRIPINGISWASWANLYSQFCVVENELIIFNSWAFNPQNYSKIYDIIQNTLQMIGKHFGRFLSDNKIQFTDLEFDSIVQWVLRMRTQSPQKFEIAQSLAHIIKQINIIKHEKDYISKQALVLKKIFQNIGQPMSDSGNAFLLLQPEDSFNQMAIEYFCHIYDYYITDLNEDYLKNVFVNLVVGGVTQPVLLIIQKISSLLANSQEYFKLRHIYQYFVLPHLTRFKASKFLSQQIFIRVQFYCIGFLRHCNIGRNGLLYLLQDIENIQNETVQQQWIDMILAVGFANFQQDLVKNQLKKKSLHSGKTISELQVDSQKVWNVTLRTGKKYKKYIKNETTQYRGIQNRANQCYIISAVQGLYFTEQLQRLVDSHREIIRNKYQLLDQLRALFSELSEKRQAKTITISYLKKCGPQQFRESRSQQDSMQYLIQLFDSIQNECKLVPGMLEKFQKIFKINCQHTTTCLNCGKSTSNVQNTYVHTIPHTQLLQLKTEEAQLEDYKCESCNKVGKCKNVREISPSSKIFIVHINRFSIKDGQCKKQLSNQTILRRFLDYELVGMICHCGKNIDSGHYKYFSKLSSKQWMQLSDRNVLKFRLDEEDEQFEREMQNDMAPYILFYRKIAS